VERIPILVSEAQPIVVEGLQKILTGHPEFELRGWVSQLNEANEAVRALRPRLLLTDQSAGLNSITRFIGTLKNAEPACHVVLWANDLSEADGMHAVQLGLRGVIKKSAPVATLFQCLREVSAGRVWMEDTSQIVGFLHRREASRLTAREREVVLLICGGLKNKQIAEKLGITAGTVKVHLMHIFEKTGLKDRFALAVHGRNLPGIRATEESGAQAGGSSEPSASSENRTSEVSTSSETRTKDSAEPRRSEVGV
jgi:two-component system nitrate/nitrite response regulator NarL